MELALTTTTSLSFEDAVAKMREALAQQGLAILSEIDVQATMKARLNVQVEPYLILSACNPPLAHQASQFDPTLGFLLPCNVVVWVASDVTHVQAMDPQLMVTIIDKPGLQAVADQASGRLRRALGQLPTMVD